MGEPRSHGCIRMWSRDLIALFDATPLGTSVEIREEDRGI
jgi:lipoprotein-anchoring transpeptidase ErfK/SrfK